MCYQNHCANLRQLVSVWIQNYNKHLIHLSAENKQSYLLKKQQQAIQSLFTWQGLYFFYVGKNFSKVTNKSTE